MLIINLIYLISSVTLVVLLALIVHNLVITSYVYWKFWRKLEGIQIIDGFNPIIGHMNSFVFRHHVLYHLNDLFAKYGPTFGYLFRHIHAVATLDLDLLKRVLVDEKSVNRTEMYLGIKEIEQDSLATSFDDQWRRIRRVFGSALRTHKVNEPNVQREIDNSINKLIRAIDAKLSENSNISVEFNLDDIIHRFSLDLALSSFCKQSNLISFDLSKPDFYVEIVDRSLIALKKNPFARLGNVFPILLPIIDWIIWNFHEQGFWRKSLRDFIERQTKLNFEARKHMNKLGQEKKYEEQDNITLDDGSIFERNMMDHVIDRFYEGKISRREYLHSSSFLVQAADKTVADSLVHTIYQLSINPDIQDKLRQSIVDEGITSDYLTWVLNESLRLLPPVNAGCSRKLDRDLKTENQFIPAKTFVLGPAYSIHRLEKYWGHDVEDFKPERFANTDHFHPFQFVPFGHGPRGCPGKEFALQEMKKLLSALLIRYKFQCEPIKNRYNALYWMFLISDKETFVRISKI